MLFALPFDPLSAGQDVAGLTAALPRHRAECGTVITFLLKSEYSAELQSRPYNRRFMMNPDLKLNNEPTGIARPFRTQVRAAICPRTSSNKARVAVSSGASAIKRNTGSVLERRTCTQRSPKSIYTPSRKLMGRST